MPIDLVNASKVKPDPLITIGITCHSEGDWLRECWESVLAQTDDRWEAVMVMDGTTHARTREIFAALEHPRLRKVALPENRGPYPARNTAFELTRTPFHFYLDGDDLLFPDSVARVLRTFDDHPEAGLVYGDYQCFGGSDEVWRYPAALSRRDYAKGQPIPGPCAYRKQAWELLGGFCLDLSRGNADYDFMIGACEAGLTAVHCGGIFYRYRVGHPGKVSNSYRLAYHKTHEIMVRRHPIFFSNSFLRRRFLAEGYRRAALANQEAGNSQAAGELARSACRNGLWFNGTMTRLAMQSFLPR